MTKITKVLVVDDNSELVELFRDSLLDLSFNVVTALSAEEALDLFKAGDFDCIVTDVIMPGMSGVELISHIRQLRPSMPVYFITGYLDYSRSLLDQFRPKAIIFKPFDVEEAALLLKNHSFINS